MADTTRPAFIPGVETFYRREVWQDPKQPVTGPAPTMDQWDTFPLHYTAAINLPDGDLGEFSYDIGPFLRAVQRSYLQRTPPYSVGYLFAVDWLGGVWEIRGFDLKGAANLGWNNRTAPVLCLVDGQDALTAEALWSVRALYAESQRRSGRSLNLVGHRDIGSTTCPGTGIYNQIRSGLVTPLTVEELNPNNDPKDEDMAPFYWKHSSHPELFVMPSGVHVNSELRDAMNYMNGAPLHRITSNDSAMRDRLMALNGYTRGNDGVWRIA